METANELRKIGLEVTEAVVLLDRKQGGGENLAKHGITMSSVFHIEEVKPFHTYYIFLYNYDRNRKSLLLY